jgi:hypothetical protein
MSFTDQKRFVASAKDCKKDVWGSGFKCGICGHKFVEGDGVRWVYANGNSPSYGNFMVCDSCDSPDVLQRRTNAGNYARALEMDAVIVAASLMNKAGAALSSPSPATEKEK